MSISAPPFSTTYASEPLVYFLAEYTSQRAAEPVNSPDAALDTSGEGVGTAGATKRLRILIIEDNQDYAEGLQLIFELSGHSAEIAQNGTAGVAAALQDHPDAIVCDIGLPGMDGFQVATTLRRTPATAETYLVAVTGYGSDADRKRSAEAGFNAHLLKPVDPCEILRLIEANRESKTVS